MRLQLVTTDRQVLDTEIEEVYAPGVRGQFGVLPLHVNFLTALDTGELRYRTHGKDHWIAVRGGVAEVLGDTVTILADQAAVAEEIDPESARTDATSAEAALEQAEPGSADAAELESALAWARAREVVAARR